jgi:hypothetical protein
MMDKETRDGRDSKHRSAGACCSLICSQFIFLAFIRIMNINLIRRTYSVAIIR